MKILWPFKKSFKILARTCTLLNFSLLCKCFTVKTQVDYLEINKDRVPIFCYNMKDILYCVIVCLIINKCSVSYDVSSLRVSKTYNSETREGPHWKAYLKIKVQVHLKTSCQFLISVVILHFLYKHNEN